MRFSRAARSWKQDTVLRAPVSGCPLVSLLPEEHTKIGLIWCSTSEITSVFWAVDTVQAAVFRRLLFSFTHSFYVPFVSGSHFRVCLAQGVEDNWSALGDDLRYYSRFQRSWLASGYSLTRQSTEHMADIHAFLREDGLPHAGTKCRWSRHSSSACSEVPCAHR